jgi:hypothetical protein
MQAQIFNQIGEDLVAGHKVGFAVNLYQYADAAVVNIAANQAGAGVALAPVLGVCVAFFAHGFESFVKIKRGLV